MDLPSDLRYTKEHEWARDEGEGRVRVGITDYAQEKLGDVVYVDLPEPGTELRAMESFGEVESTKSVSDLFSPVDGTVIERNPLLEERPELVNTEPYGAGWMVLVEARDLGQLGSLLDADSYRAYVEELEGGG